MPSLSRHAISALAVALQATAWSDMAFAADAAKCYDWTSAAPIVVREKLVSAADIHQQARAAQKGELIRITLCEEGGRFVYRLVLQQRGGKVQNLTIDARRPFPR